MNAIIRSRLSLASEHPRNSNLQNSPENRRCYSYADLLVSGITMAEFASACGIKNCKQWKTKGVPYKHQRIVRRMMENQKDYKSGLFSFTNSPEKPLENLHAAHQHKTNKNNGLTADFIPSLGIVRNSEPTKQSVRFFNPDFVAKREALRKAKNALGEAQKFFKGCRSEVQESRALRYVRQNIARALLFDRNERVCRCGRHIHFDAEGVEIFKNYENGRAFYKGVEVCGSVWMCPPCAAKVSERRRAELVHATTQHLDRCGQDSLMFVTLTFPHHQHDNLEDLLHKLSKATAYFYRHRDYKNLKKNLEKLGYVRALETTHGYANGWHPHIHEIWFFGENQDKGYFPAIKKEIFAIWSRACSAAGLPAPSWKHGVDVRDARYAAGYITKFGDDHRKWGMEDELTKSGAKKGKVDKDGVLLSRTPFQLLDAYAVDGDKAAGALFREYAAAFKGKQQVRWSNGLKSLYGIQDYSDQQLAQKTESAAYRYFSVSLNDWRIVRQTCNKVSDTRSTVLDASETLTYSEFEDFIDVLASRQKRSELPLPDLPDFGDFEQDVALCLSLIGVSEVIL